MDREQGLIAHRSRRSSHCARRRACSDTQFDHVLINVHYDLTLRYATRRLYLIAAGDVLSSSLKYCGQHMIATPTVEFFYDCSSPWTYFAFTRIIPLMEQLGLPIVWRPILVGGVFNAVNQELYATRAAMFAGGADNRRLNYYVKDMQDWARLCAVRADLCIGCGLCVTLGNPTAPQQREFGCPADYDAINMMPWEDVLKTLTSENVEVRS